MIDVGTFNLICKHLITDEKFVVGVTRSKNAQYATVINAGPSRRSWVGWKIYAKTIDPGSDSLPLLKNGKQLQIKVEQVVGT